MTVRFAESDEDIIEVHRLLLRFGMEASDAPVDPVKTMKVLYDVVKNHAAIVAEIDGKIVGSIGVITTEYWYSNDTYLIDLWLYVYPEYRDSGALQAMLEEARNLADASGKRLLISVSNPNRVRGIPGRLGKIATFLRYAHGGTALGYVPSNGAA